MNTDLAAPKEIRTAWRRFNRVDRYVRRWRIAGTLLLVSSALDLLVLGPGWVFYALAATSITSSIIAVVQLRMSDAALKRLIAYYAARAAEVPDAE